MVKRENIDELSIGTSDRISNIEGDNLSVDLSGNLNASGGGGGGGEGHLVETFEDGDITDYEGDTGSFSAIAGNIVGGNMLQFDGSVNNDANAIATNSITTQRGMAYATYIRTGSDTDIAAGLIVCATISNGTVTEGYNINIRGSGNSFALDYKTSSTGWLQTTLDSAAATISGGTLYRIEVALSPTDIRAELINVDTATSVATISNSTADATAYESGGWGYYGGSGASVNADYDMGTRTPEIWVV